MNLHYSLPILISIAGFLAYSDSESHISSILRSEKRWQDSDSIRMRLKELGRETERDYENFRIAQMALVLTVIVSATAGYIFNFLGFFTSILCSVSLSTFAIYVTDRNLSRRCVKRREEIEREFPAIVQMLTLAIAAGESPARAFRRIAARSQGYLSDLIRMLVKDVEAGTPFASALDSMSRSMKSESLRKFSDSIVISLLRGSSLVETMNHVAQEAHLQERNKLLSAAGKSEISMMIPVVFLILPVSIVFALYPSLTNLKLFAQ